MTKLGTIHCQKIIQGYKAIYLAEMQAVQDRAIEHRPWLESALVTFAKLALFSNRGRLGRKDMYLLIAHCTIICIEAPE